LRNIGWLRKNVRGLQIGQGVAVMCMSRSSLDFLALGWCVANPKATWAAVGDDIELKAVLMADGHRSDDNLVGPALKRR